MESKKHPEEGRVMLSLTDNYYVVIGACLSRWAALEYEIQNIIWAAMGLTIEEGRVLTVGMGLQALVGISRNLGKRVIKDEQIKKEIEELMDRVWEYYDFRNNLAHGIWTFIESNPVPHLTYMKEAHHRFVPGIEPITTQQMFTFSQDVLGFCQKAEEIAVKLRGDVKP